MIRQLIADEPVIRWSHIGALNPWSRGITTYLVHPSCGSIHTCPVSLPFEAASSQTWERRYTAALVGAEGYNRVTLSRSMTTDKSKLTVSTGPCVHRQVSLAALDLHGAVIASPPFIFAPGLLMIPAFG
jgi:hypothetical protein